MLEQCGIPHDSELAGMITYQWPDVGLPTSKLPFVVFARKARSHGKACYYPKGGGRVLVEALMNSFLEANAGKLLVRAPVETIDTDDAGRVTGVSVKGVHVNAPMVISAAGAYTTFVRMMPAAAKEHPCSEKAQRESAGDSGSCGSGGDGERSGGDASGRHGRVRRRSLSRFEFEVDEDAEEVEAGAAGAARAEAEVAETARVPARRLREFNSLRRSLFAGGTGATDKCALPLSRTWVSLFIGFDADNSVSEHEVA